MSGDVLTPEERAAVRSIATRHDAAEKVHEMYGRRGTRDPAVADRGALLRIIDRLSTPQVPEWRPATETEPRDGVPVLTIYVDDGKVTGAAVAGRCGPAWFEDGHSIFPPSHWMPLPAAPGANHIGEPTAMVAEVACLREAIDRLAGAEMRERIRKVVVCGWSVPETTDAIMSLLKGEGR